MMLIDAYGDLRVQVSCEHCGHDIHWCGNQNMHTLPALCGPITSSLLAMNMGRAHRAMGWT